MKPHQIVIGLFIFIILSVSLTSVISTNNEGAGTSAQVAVISDQMEGTKTPLSPYMQEKILEPVAVPASNASAPEATPLSTDLFEESTPPSPHTGEGVTSTP